MQHDKRCGGTATECHEQHQIKVQNYNTVCVVLNNSGSGGIWLLNLNFFMDKILMVDRDTTLPPDCLVLLGWAQEVSSGDFHSLLTCRKEYGIFPAGLAPSAPGTAEQTQAGHQIRTKVVPSARPDRVPSPSQDKNNIVIMDMSNKLMAFNTYPQLFWKRYSILKYYEYILYCEAF